MPEIPAWVGHTRLRIIDLDPRADQPMSDPEERYWCTFNGEIYNFRELRVGLEADGWRFRTQGDTEVLLALYHQHREDPIAMLHRLRGMFAFALIDIERQSALIARDRFGLKPLYISTYGPARLAFASEARALRAAGLISGDVAREAVDSYLGWGSVPAPLSPFQGASALLPGEAVLWTRDGYQRRRWFIPRAEPERMSFDEAIERTQEALQESVDRHLISDRPTVLHLSGGADSFAIAAMSRGRLTAMTLAFPDGETPDESAEAAAVAMRFDLAHQTITLSESEAASLVPQLVRDMDSPTADGINIGIIADAARRVGAIVQLSGVGGDELFGGYATFRQARRFGPAIKAVNSRALRGICHPISRFASTRRPSGFLARALDAGPGTDQVRRALRGYHAQHERPWTGNTSGQPWHMMDLIGYLPDQLLRDADQMGMRVSAELRVPLIDDVFARAILRIPLEHRMRPAKELLLRATGRSPGGRKLGFSVPMERWMRGPLEDYVREGLASNALPLARDITETYLRRVREAWEADRIHWSRPWSIVVLRHWAATAARDSATWGWAS